MENWGGGTAFIARWTIDWDCEHETNWWYVIKDEPFDINSLKSKRRYEIKKGNKNFEVRIINPVEYIDEIYEVTVEAFSSWPQKYRPSVDEGSFKKSLYTWNNKCVFGAFSRENGSLCGYATVEEYSGYAAFTTLRVKPEAEKNAINAAVVNCILEEYNSKLGKKFYVCDGARSVRHETAFQDYLVKYFGFRKAYCRLCIKYKGMFGMMVKILFPFRRLIKGKTGIGSKISAILRMEEYTKQ